MKKPLSKIWRVCVHFRADSSHCPSRNADILQFFLCDTFSEAIQTATAWKISFPSAFVSFTEEQTNTMETL